MDTFKYFKISQQIDSNNRFIDPNMYRTAYADQCNGRETCVKSNYPSGYCGHIPVIRHDLLFHNNEIYQRFADINPYDKEFLKPIQKVQGPRVGYFPDVQVLPPWATYTAQFPNLYYKNTIKKT